ncbi:MAG: regulatory protein RecX, partial [Bacteroidales bacterium]
MERKQHIYTEQEAYQKLSALCAMSEQCCHDMMRKMSRWQMDQEVAEKVVARLVKEGFINEERYARAFVRDKFRYNHWGEVKIKHELKLKGISQKHIEAGLEE